MLFNELQLNPQIQKAINEVGYLQATPIQEKAIPIVLNQEDLLACAQTGTGKTAAFSLPLIELLSRQRPNGKIRCLILTPTRELAIQIGENINEYSKYTSLKSLVIFGGVNQNPQANALKNGVDILVATPGRLLDLVQQKLLNLQFVEKLVLDEADRMLDMGFVHDVKRIIQIIPKQRQTLFFSATMPSEIQKLADSILHQPQKISITPVSTTVEIIQQKLYYVDRENKNALTLELLKDRNIKSVLIFTRTKYGADKLVKVLQKHHITAEAIHGNKTQNNRQKALTNFKSQKTRVLVATDIAARGIDVENLELVINYEITNLPETYVHRIGRTGRAGADGIAISLCDADEIDYVKDIEKLIGKKIDVVNEHDFVMELPTAKNQIKNQSKIKKPQKTGHSKPNSTAHKPQKNIPEILTSRKSLSLKLK